MPMAMFTFLERYAFDGKKICPFCTHEGSGMGNSEQDSKQICKGAVFKKGIAVQGCRVETSENKIAAWAKEAVQ